MSIDVDRGVISRLHREAGVRVYMYWDKPGYYFDDHERNLSDEFAAQAGFQTELHAKERFKAEKMAEFNKQVDLSLAAAEEAEDKEVLRQKGEYKALAMPYGAAIVVDGEGNKLTPSPVPRESAFGLLDALVPTVATPKKAKEKEAAK